MQSWASGADSAGKHDIYSLGENFGLLFVRPVTHCLLFSLVKSLCCVSSPGSDSTGWVQLEFPQRFRSHFDEFVPDGVQIHCRKVSPSLNATHRQSFCFPVCLCRWHSSSQVFCQMSSANVRLHVHAAEQALLPVVSGKLPGERT